MIIYFTLFGTLFIAISRSYDNCSTVANCTHQSYKRDYECNNGICEERTCYNDTKCIEDDLWYGPGYRCDMSTNNYECINDCVNNTDCTSGYLCCHSGGCYGNCVQCLIDTDCAVNEYCDSSENCQTSCNGNDTYCQVEYWYYDNMVCDSNGACVQRECYSNTDCDNKNYTNYRCDTSGFSNWHCVEKCNATSCTYSWEPFCNSNGECEAKNCINTANLCDDRTEICNSTTGWCDRIACESNNDCTTQGNWYCDDIIGYCYMDCLYYNSSYCNSVMWYGKYGARNYKCSNTGECLGHDCTSNIDCQIKYNASWVICDTVTNAGQAVCSGPNCINTNNFCDIYGGGPGSVCNSTSGSCYTPPCSDDLACQDYLGNVYYNGLSIPIAFCNRNTGECDANCTHLDSPGCDGFDVFLKTYSGTDLGFEPTCSSSGSCYEIKNCFNDTDCSGVYKCFSGYGGAGFAGICFLPCTVDTDCYGRMLQQNNNGVECVAFPPDSGRKWCIPLTECEDDEDCRQGDQRGRKCTNNYCKSVECIDNANCISEFDNDKAICSNGYCLDNGCVQDSDCIAPFNACYKDRADTGYSYGYQCYTECEYNNETTTDDVYCTNLFGADNNGDDIMCAKGAPGNDNLTYCDIYSVNYTSCILFEYSCDDTEECNRDTGECELITSAPTTSTTQINICKQGDKCNGRAKNCNRDGRNDIPDTDSDKWCGWCLCSKLANYENPLDECAYFALTLASSGSKKWHDEFVDDLKELFMETCFSRINPSQCSFDDVEVIKNPTGCDCEQFKCNGEVGTNPGDVGGVGCYGVFGVISVVLIMVLWM